jgi:acyl-CoA thioester hydrolase
MKNIAYIENFDDWINGFTYSYPVKVRFSETDLFGHLNNTKVFVYFEEGRIEFFKEIGIMQQWLTSGGDGIPVTSDLQCNYLRQLFFDERLQVFVKINAIGKTSVDLHYMIKNHQGEICITGRGRMVQVHKKTGKPFEWDENMMEKLKSSIASANI